ncbi:hypothetical protein AURDEDRAFT_50127 [Auricularia subglabra TFB-10046 SS5]|nr:hypothetical protein AURDEDRAFT_50127 [Auricularia subglabra TFB-10046 SS5]
MPVAAAAPKSPAKKKAAPRKSAAAKRRISQVQDDGDDDEAEPSPKRAAVPAAADSPGGVRRSSRHAGKPRVSYTGEVITLTDSPAPSPVKAIKRKEGRAENVGNRLGTRIHNPKTYGSIPGIEVGTWWETRAQCSTDAIHAPFVAGISAGPKGAYSIALSGGYEDDVDLGYAFTYTGSGGRDLKGTPTNRKNLRTAPQSSHQSWDNSFNAALKKPVRVIRGYKLHSEWAPASGYRYDGLYRVEKVKQQLGAAVWVLMSEAGVDGKRPQPRGIPSLQIRAQGLFIRPALPRSSISEGRWLEDGRPASTTEARCCRCRSSIRGRGRSRGRRR